MDDAPRFGRTDQAAAVAALTDGHRLGPFFTVSARPEPAADWRSLRELCLDEVLAERVELTRATLARSAGIEHSRVQPRVAASVLSLGVFSRLISPLLGAALTGGVLPNVKPENLWWQPVSAGLLPIAIIPSGTTWTGDARTLDGRNSLAAAFERDVLGQLVDPLVAAFRRLGVSPVVLRGNVVSSIGGALTMLNNTDRSGWSLLEVLVSQPYLLGTAVVGPWGMRRRSCCMFYRVQGIGYCGDCVLTGEREG